MKNNEKNAHSCSHVPNKKCLSSKNQVDDNEKKEDDIERKDDDNAKKEEKKTKRKEDDARISRFFRNKNDFKIQMET